MFFDSGTVLVRTVVVGTLASLALVALLRLAGKRTLSKWNAFDLVVTVAFGSTLATALLSKDTSLAQGVVAFALLVGRSAARPACWRADANTSSGNNRMTSASPSGTSTMSSR